MSRTTYTLERSLPTKIVDNQNNGRIRITWLNPSQYFIDVRATGTTPPATHEANTWTRLDSQFLEYNYIDPVDIYIYAASEAGRIIVDTDPPTTNVKIVDTGGDAIEIDATTRALTTVGYAHHEMHSGNHYFIKTWLENTGATGTFNEFIFVTPNTTTRAHAKVSIVSDADSTFDIYEDATMIDLGTPVPGINNDRDSTNVSELKPYASPTVDTTGTLIWAARTGGGKSSVGVGLAANFEIIAKTNTIYLFRLTKNTTADTVIDVDFFWYEHASKA